MQLSATRIFSALTFTGLTCVLSYIVITVARWFHPALFTAELTLATLVIGVVLILVPLLRKPLL